MRRKKTTPVLSLQPHPAMIACVGVLARLNRLIATDPELGASPLLR